jgi:hypothetical protein
MSQCIYLTDLDDTLFRSLRKHPGTDGLIRVTTATNGHHGHMNPAQRGFFASLRATGAIIPVTARSTDAFARVHLDFGTRRAILANGAVVLDEHGAPDQDWLAHTARIGRRMAPLMRDMLALVRAKFGQAARTWIVEEYGAPVYLCVKMNSADEGAVKDGILTAQGLLIGGYDLSGMWSHLNGNNLAFIPCGISKREACVHLIDRLGDRNGAPLIGIGDSVTDLPFMGLCDYLVTPCGSQIAELMWSDLNPGASK